jgi:hypothetical protein
MENDILARMARLDGWSVTDRRTIKEAMEEIARLREDLATAKARNTRLLSQLQEHECRDQ